MQVPRISFIAAEGYGEPSVGCMPHQLLLEQLLYSGYKLCIFSDLNFRFFNIRNRANFAVPKSSNNTDIFDSTGAPTGVAGLLTSTSTTSRQIQFALKFVW
jgi:hypothetical protein